MKNKLIAFSLILSSLASTSMEKPTIAGNPAIQSENAYAQALFNADVAEVKSFLQGGAHADRFIKLPGQGLQKVGYEITPFGKKAGIEYTKLTPIEFLFSNLDSSRENKLAVAEALLNHGADADKSFINSLLFSAVNDGDLKLVQWLIKRGARNESALEEAKTQLSVASAEEKEAREKIYKILNLITILKK